MRAPYLAVFMLASLAFAEEPPTHRPLTTTESAAVEEALAVGHRILAAWSHYAEATRPSARFPTSGLVSSTPTLELLHVTRLLSDPDFALSLRYRAGLYPVPANATATQPLLTLETDLGEVVFDNSGNITLQISE